MRDNIGFLVLCQVILFSKRRRREVKSGSFPNLFVDDCRNSCSDRLFRSFRLSGEQQFTLSLSSSQIQSINKIIIINVFICHKIKTTNVMLHIFHSKKRN